MAGEQQESWIKWVALTTTILAVCAAIGSLKGGGYSTKVGLLTTQEANKWSYFQSKSIKQSLMETKKDLLDLELLKSPAPEVKVELEKKIAAALETAGRYEKEKAQIKAEAESLNAQQGQLKVHGGNFGMSVMFFQIAIMLSAIGSLLKKRYAWIIGLVMGAIGLVYFANGFFTFFNLMF
ncbi:MAG: DUF4337 domain-containing protein [Candidatus Omnitrophica bacterium]|nr:DUF4337 domain-containing protein [Candidatus Omnitrophota bacterium]